MPQRLSGPATVAPDLLREDMAQVLAAYGLDTVSATTVADCLVEADLRGVYTHGTSRLGIYAKRLSQGLMNCQPNIRVERSGAATAVIDGDNGMGAVVGMRAVTEATEIALQSGVAVVTVRHTNHIGIVGYYAEHLARAGLISLVCTNASPTMVPYGGRQARFGTNPFAFGVPTPEGPPLIADMATSVVAKGKIILAHQRGEKIPDNWAVDSKGRPTDDPAIALGGYVIPFGDKKGSAVALFVDLLAGILAGANSGVEVPDFFSNFERPSNIGQFILAIDPGRFQAPDKFLARVRRMAELIHSCAPAEGVDRVRLPGDVELEHKARQLQEGITLTADIVVMLYEAADAARIKLRSLPDA
jgi:LDH2 family malate/lactate/ureidoglycolate dehydrogenase